ncbi:hypothetical protein BaRGS_00040572, partial [Batillaria attramentaria]
MRLLHISKQHGSTSGATPKDIVVYEEYSEEADFVGASPFFNTPVFKLHPSKESQTIKEEHLLVNQLQKSTDYSYFWDPGSEMNLVKILQDYVGDINPAYVWISDSLPVDLNLPMTSHPPRSSVQVFLIAQDLPPIVLTVYDHENTVPKDVELFTVEMARLLTWRLLDFCHDDFLLLACTLTWKNCTTEALHGEVTKQMDYSCRYFGGIKELDDHTLDTLKNATHAVANASYVPALYIENDEELWLLLLETEWRDVLSGILEMLLRGDTDSFLTYTAETEFKVKVAVMEAARRLSFRDEVVICTPEKKIHECVENMKWQADEEFKVQLKLHPSFDGEEAVSGSAEYVIGIDCPTESSEETEAEIYGWDVLRG